MAPTRRPSPAWPAAALMASACAVDSEAPRLLDAEFESSEYVVLTFSEPIAPVDGLEPRRFRLGAAFVLEDSTHYYDIAHHFEDGVPGSENEPTGAPPRPRHAFNDFVEIENVSGDESKVRLRLYDHIEAYVCDAIEMASALGIPAAIHLHYDPGSHAPLADQAGNALEPIGPDWVSAVFSDVVDGEYPDLDEFFELPCPTLPDDP